MPVRSRSFFFVPQNVKDSPNREGHEVSNPGSSLGRCNDTHVDVGEQLWVMHEATVPFDGNLLHAHA